MTQQKNPLSRIRELRKQRGMTLLDLATAAETTPQTIQRLETGGMTLSLRWMHKIAGILSVPPHALVPTPEAKSDDEVFIELLRAEIVRARRNASAANDAGLALMEASGKLAEGLAEYRAGLRQWHDVMRLAAATAAAAMRIGVDGRPIETPAAEPPRLVELRP